MLFVSVKCADEIDRSEYIPLHKVDRIETNADGGDAIIVGHDVYYPRNDNGIFWSIIDIRPMPNSYDDDDPIEKLNFSVRTYNALHRQGIRTVKELSKKTLSDLHRIRNVGRGTLNEIEEKMLAAGYSLAVEEKGRRG